MYSILIGNFLSLYKSVWRAAPCNSLGSYNCTCSRQCNGHLLVSLHFRIASVLSPVNIGNFSYYNVQTTCHSVTLDTIWCQSMGRLFSLQQSVRSLNHITQQVKNMQVTATRSRLLHCMVLRQRNFHLLNYVLGTFWLISKGENLSPKFAFASLQLRFRFSETQG